jgi:PAS domain S-box-containing protein
MPSILVIDDKNDNLVTITALLKNLMPDCTVLAARSGPEGIDKALAELPDTILLDVVMPGMDGFETCRRLKADDRIKYIPIIMLTAIRTESQNRLKALEMGADAFLAKPIDEYELVSQLKVALRIKKAEDSLRKEAQELVRSAAREWSTSFDAMSDGVSIHGADHTILRANRTLCRILGKRETELIGKKCYDIFHGTDKPIADCPLELSRKTLREEHAEFFEPAFKKWLSVSSAPVLDDAGQLLRIVHVVRDITHRKQAEEEREATIRLLSMLNSENGFHDMIKLISMFLHDWSGCEAVGIRLREGNDFPYFEAKGFPVEFVLAENKLCVENLDGQIALDEIGNPQLECMCGNVLCGRTDPSKPFFTAQGSFWSNCTTELLATTTEADRQARTRNRCNGEGYESVALIPLRMGKTTFGLIQLNDKRPGRFTPDSIALMERMANSIAICLAQRKAQQDLRAKEQQLSRVMETSPVGITQVDAEGEITFANLQAEKILGLSRDRLTGLTYNAPAWKITDYEGNPLPDDELPFRRVMATHEPVYDVRHAIAWPDDKRVWLSINAAPLLNESGQLEGMVASLTDITENRRREEERKGLEERLHRAEKMEALGQLAGGVAHDLNNILGVSTIYSELLQEKIPEDSALRKYVDNILSSMEKAAAIIQDLLTLARRSVIASDVINLNSVVSDFLKTPVFEKIQGFHPNVTFRAQNDENLLNIKGSSLHIEKTVMNLVSNAAEAISGKGSVTIRTENRYLDAPVSGYESVNEGDYSVLTVSDTGMGIPAESMGKIFEPFYTKKTMGRSGTGLGLAIVWGTVRDHHGYIDVQTEVGKGTIFTLYFPMTREELTGEQRKIPMEQYMGNGESILVVDDIAEQRDVADRLLKRLGYTVHLVSSGKEAVEYLKNDTVDLVLLDMIMAPGMDGLETYQRILEIHPRQRAIVVSGFSETERVKKAQELGAGAYVSKPYLIEKIGMAIHHELRRV